MASRGHSGVRFDGTIIFPTCVSRKKMMLLAYIDMALGSMLLQAMAGMVIAAMVMGRRLLAAPLAWISSRSAARESESEIQEKPELSADP